MGKRTSSWVRIAGVVALVLVLGGALVAANLVAGLLTTPRGADPHFRNNEVVAVDGDHLTIGAGAGSSLPGSRWGLRSDNGHVSMVELVGPAGYQGVGGPRGDRRRHDGGR